jgi:hypothetical protein
VHDKRDEAKGLSSLQISPRAGVDTGVSGPRFQGCCRCGFEK